MEDKKLMNEEELEQVSGGVQPVILDDTHLSTTPNLPATQLLGDKKKDEPPTVIKGPV